MSRGPGTMRKKNHWIQKLRLRGNMRSGRRQTREMKEDKQTVPMRVEKVCERAARMSDFVDCSPVLS